MKELVSYSNTRQYLMATTLMKLMIFMESIYLQVYNRILNTKICFKNYNLTDAPIFVYIHGGYWQRLNKSISAYCVDPLVTAGIKVIVLEYDLCPTVTLSELVEQVTKFGKFILTNSKYAQSR